MRAREAAFDVSEQLALDQLFRNRRAVDFHEGFGFPRAQGVDGVRHQLFPGTALAVDQHAAVGRGHQLHLLAQRLHGHAVADDAVFRLRVAAQPHVFELQPPVIQRVLQHHGELLDGKRLLQKIEGAQLGGLDGGLNIAVAGDHDHRRPVADGNLLDARERLHAIDPRQPDIEQHQLGGLARQIFQALFARGYGPRLIALVVQHPAQGLPDAGLVVHHQNPRGLHTCVAGIALSAARASSAAASVAMGISMMKRVPAGRLSSTRMCAL